MLKALILSFAVLMGLAACSYGEPLPACKGPVFQLNPGYWAPAPAVPGAVAS